jgi:hypothetical protein
MRALIIGAFVAALASPAISKPTPQRNLLGCTLPSDTVERGLAELLMPLELPYLDHQVVYYRDENTVITSYAIRRSLHIFFYTANETLMGTAVRRTATHTAYFDPQGKYLGRCINHKMELPYRANRAF